MQKPTKRVVARLPKQKIDEIRAMEAKASSFDMPLNLDDQKSKIKVIGVGGGGCNAVKHMVDKGLDDVGFAYINTDHQALQRTQGGDAIQIGRELTKGLGAGTQPSIGRCAALESEQLIRDNLKELDMLFVTAGMGGGTGTGAIPVIAEIARDMGVLTVAVVTKPFNMEGQKKCQIAKEGTDFLKQYVDAIITIPNQKLLSTLGNNVTLEKAFMAVNDVLLNAVRGITEVIMHPGFINVDFADVRTVMTQGGVSIMGIGSAEGEERAVKATQEAIACPLLESFDLKGARGILVNIQSSDDLSLHEFQQVGDMVSSLASDEANIKVGTSFDSNLGNKVVVTVIATGLEDPEALKVVSQKNQQPPSDDSRGTRADERLYAKPVIVKKERPVEQIKEINFREVLNQEEVRFIETLNQEKPPVFERLTRQAKEREGGVMSFVPKSFTEHFDLDNYKIPSFLRKI